MPLYSHNGLAIAGRRPILSPDLCTDDGQEDFASSEHSGRWLGGLIVLRKSFKNIVTDTVWAPNTVSSEPIMQLPNPPNYGFYIMDAFIQAKIDVGSSPSGNVAFTLGTNESGSYDNVIAGPSRTPVWPPVVWDWQTNVSTYGTMVGMGGHTAYRTYRYVYARMDNSGFSTLNASPVTVTIIGYLLPDPTVSTS